MMSEPMAIRLLVASPAAERLAMPAIALRFMVAFHCAQQIRRVGDLVLVDHIGMMRT